MEESAQQRNISPASSSIAPSGDAAPVPWRDLRDWIELIDGKGLLKRIDKPVDPDEELAAIAFMATRQEDAPALLFDNLAGATAPARACWSTCWARARSVMRSPSGSTPLSRLPR